MAFLICPMARAASMVGTATRTISQPACSKRSIWATVAATSSVRVLHMDWMATAAPPPMVTPPMFICLLMGHPSSQVKSFHTSLKVTSAISASSSTNPAK